MIREAETSVLNRLVVIHNRSLPRYLVDAPPWRQGRDDRAEQLFRQMADDQQRMADRLAKLILRQGGEVRSGAFPLAFTRLHDLSSDYVLGEVIQYQERTVAAIEQAVGQLKMCPMARTLAEEALGMAKAHLDALRDLAAQPVDRPA